MDEVITGGARPQRRKAKAVSWTKTKRKQFLDLLAETCNVRRSCEAVGMGRRSLYALRHRDPGFAELWRIALRTGYDRLEERLLCHAGGGINDIEIEPGDDAPAPFDPRLALDLLRFHAAGAKGVPRASVGRVTRVPRAEAEAALLKKLDALEKRMGAKRIGQKGEGEGGGA